jgi:predicted transporter
MDLNILLWIGGMLFSLGIFALKVGLGLGYGKVKLRGIIATLTSYLVLFMVIALLAERLIRWLEPILRKGPYLHIILAAGLIAWGSYIIGSRGDGHAHTVRTGARLMLIIPCPVCLTAMTFSTWAALNAVRLHPLLVGLGLGLAFALMAVIVMLAARLRPDNRSEAPLGLAMIVIGLYFVGSMFLPGKIEEAKGMYASFIMENAGAGNSGGTWLLAILPLVLLIGFFAKKLRREL